MRVGSLFSGYGGLDLAVGGDLAWYSEIEPAACKVMEAHHPGVPNIGDVTKVDWSQVEPVDVITGGYPCQPFSNAGMRKGTQDERHLWPYVRDALGAIRPAAAVLENVRGHLTLGFDVVLADLADLGWSARWGVVRAADAGAPHNRARLFIVASNPDNYGQPTGTRGRRLREGQELRGAQEPQGHRKSERASGAFAYPNGQGLQRRDLPTTFVGAEGLRERTANGDSAQPNANTNSASGQAHDDGRQGRGNARRPQLVERGGQAAANPSGERHGGGQRSASLGRVGCAPEGSRRQTSTARQEPGAGSAEDAADTEVLKGRSGVDEKPTERQQGIDEFAWGDYGAAIRRWESVTGRPAPAPTVQRAERDRLNPVFVEWMMGLPEGWVTGHGLSASQELKMLGNGVVPQQARLALELLGGVA